MRTCWTREDMALLKTARAFDELCGVAERVLARMRDNLGHDIEMVCGPITTGGQGSPEENLIVLGRHIKRRQQAGKIVFVQLLFEEALWRIRKNPLNSEDRLLNEFYLPLFEKGLIRRLVFVPNWETSNGARWEHRQAERLGLQIEYDKPL
ncbi:MAG: hypothetical protein Q8Q39_05460 [bacterium]|nr:hypothetical protein [bacterium]